MLWSYLLDGIVFWISLYWKVCILVSLTVINGNLKILGLTFVLASLKIGYWLDHFLTNDGLYTSILIKCQYNSLQVTFSTAFILLLILIMFSEVMFLGIKLHCLVPCFYIQTLVLVIFLMKHRLLSCFYIWTLDLVMFLFKHWPLFIKKSGVFYIHLSWFTKTPSLFF